MSAFDKGKRSRGDADDKDLLPSNSKRLRPGHDDPNGGWGHRRPRIPARLSNDDYIVGWVCALPIEMAAAQAMLDYVHDILPKDPVDSNAYTLGSIDRHNIVITCLPTDGYGMNNAATVASHMRRSFPSIRVLLMVGIGGGVPGEVDVRLGDVVVSTRVIQYDLGKTVTDGHFQRTGSSYTPPQALMTAVTKLQADHETEPSKIPVILSGMLERNPSMAKYTCRDALQDLLFDSSYDHAESSNSCQQCDRLRLVERPTRDNDNPKIHYGVVASGNRVIKHGKTRDQLAQELGNICFEMEAAGLMGDFRCLAIRGICDYSDSHKNKQWQKYAAATAAAYAKELLSVMPADGTQKMPTAALLSTSGRYYTLLVGIRLTDISTEQASIRERRKDLLDSLRFEQIDARYSNIKAAHAKTCEWLLQHSGYIDWLDSEQYAQHRGFLWINGKPGAGKSTLMKFIYTRTKGETADNAAAISFFFNARGHDLEKSTLGMHRSLLLQLLEKLPDLQEVLDNPQVSRLDFKEHSNRPTREIDILRDLFSDATERLGQRRLTCFVDALDECDAHRVRAMVDYFEDLGQRAVQTGSKLYICFSSRHYPHISIQYGRQLTLEDQDGHGQDLEKYVRSKFKAGKGKVFEEVRTEIIRKAAGIFMWVVLVVPVLNREFERGRIFAVKKRLQEIPAGLSELFKDLLRRDNENMDDLLLCIQWVLYAKWPLTREEFYFAVVSGLDPDPENLAEWNPEHISTDAMTRFVLSSSKGLAEVTKSKDQTVQFIHESVRDFLLKDKGLWELWPELGMDIKSLSHDRLKQCCHTYMKVNISSHMSPDETLPKASSDEAKKLRQHISNRFPFLKYATRHVLYHADAAAARLPQDEFLENFALKDWIKLDNLFQQYEVRRHTASASLPYILAEYNWPRLIRIACRHQPTIDIEGERHQYPLFAALANGHRDAVRALLQQEASHSQEDDISTQLEYGQDFKAWRGQTPLSWAAENGHEAIVKLLLETSKVNADSKDNYGRTTLWWAARNGHEAVVKCASRSLLP